MTLYGMIRYTLRFIGMETYSHVLVLTHNNFLVAGYYELIVLHSYQLPKSCIL